MQHVADGKPRLLTTTEVAALLGICPAFVSDLARRHPPAICVEEYSHFNSEVLARWIEAEGVGDRAVGDMRRSSEYVKW